MAKWCRRESWSGRQDRVVENRERADLTVALPTALTGINDDVGEAGYSPTQWVLGRAPRRFVSTLGGGARRLSVHSAAEGEAEFSRRVGMMGTARIAVTRLKLSRELRTSLLARTRSRSEALELKVGDIAYFFRKQARQGGMDKKNGKLVFNTWRGPGILFGIEGNAGMHRGYRGHVTKRAPEAVRLATSHEQLAAEDWAGALADVLTSAQPDHTPPAQVIPIVPLRRLQ